MSRRKAGLLCLALLLWLAATGIARAREQSTEFWPEVDVWWRLTPACRLSSFISISKNVETAYREGSVILQADYSWGRTHRAYKIRLLDENRAQEMKTMMVRGGYLYGQSLDDDGQAYTEHTMLLELHVRTPLKNFVLLSHRLRTDLRWLGEDAEFSSRWRYRIMAEKEISAGKCSIVPYVNAEPYYDSRYNTINRVRLIGGATVSWSPRFALEGNFTYQHDTRSSVTNLDALNVILHLYFERGYGR